MHKHSASVTLNTTYGTDIEIGDTLPIIQFHFNRLQRKITSGRQGKLITQFIPITFSHQFGYMMAYGAIHNGFCQHAKSWVAFDHIAFFIKKNDADWCRLKETPEILFCAFYTFFPKLFLQEFPDHTSGTNYSTIFALNQRLCDLNRKNGAIPTCQL